MNTSCIVLAGGKSTRLGRNKLAETVGEKMLLHRVLDVLIRLGREVILVASESSSLPDISAYTQTRIVKDMYPGKGLLGGIYTGLSSSDSHYNIVVAADMPFLNFDLLQYMLSIAGEADLVAHREGERFEPLHAIYSRNCMKPIGELMRQKNVRILEIADRVNTRYLTKEAIDRYDPQHFSFFNINTEEELQTALKIERNGLKPG